MKRLALLLALVALVAGGATVATQLALRHWGGEGPWPDSADTRHEDHAWLHRQLGVTVAQEARLEASEKRFAAAAAAASARLAAANRALADALGRNATYGAEVAQAVDQVHAAQSEVQKIALEHYFELLAELTPEQAAQLRAMTRAGLVPEARH